MNQNMDEKLRDLLCDRAVFGLDSEEAKQLDELSGGANGGMDAQSYEMTAAAIMLAETKMESMPAGLEAKLLKVADEYFGAKGTAEIHESIHDQPTRNFTWSEPKRSRSFFDWFGWAVAAAACVVIGVMFFSNQSRIAALQNELAQAKASPSPAPSLAELRDRLKASGAEVARAEWKKGNYKDTETVTGEVVWSDAEQKGYMTFRGLPVNDANLQAYQLWIFEDANLEPHPKDGGVFNVTANGEVIVPIDAKLRVTNPKAFAITVERPGGVVVSDRSKIALLGPVKPSSV